MKNSQTWLLNCCILSAILFLNESYFEITELFYFHFIMNHGYSHFLRPAYVRGDINVIEAAIGKNRRDKSTCKIPVLGAIFTEISLYYTHRL
jgi:hypothetical protein